jgi:hypothetical protein
MKNQTAFNVAEANQLKFLDSFNDDIAAFIYDQILNGKVRSAVRISEIPDLIGIYANYCVELQKAKTLVKLWEETEKEPIIEKHITVLTMVLEYYEIILDLKKDFYDGA